MAAAHAAARAAPACARGRHRQAEDRLPQIEQMFES